MSHSQGFRSRLSSPSHICMVIPCLVSCYTRWEMSLYEDTACKVETAHSLHKIAAVVRSVRAVSAHLEGCHYADIGMKKKWRWRNSANSAAVREQHQITAVVCILHAEQLSTVILKGTVWRVGKYPYLPFCSELEKTNTSSYLDSQIGRMPVTSNMTYITVPKTTWAEAGIPFLICLQFS